MSSDGPGTGGGWAAGAIVCNNAGAVVTIEGRALVYPLCRYIGGTSKYPRAPSRPRGRTPRSALFWVQYRLELTMTGDGGFVEHPAGCGTSPSIGAIANGDEGEALVQAMQAKKTEQGWGVLNHNPHLGREVGRGRGVSLHRSQERGGNRGRGRSRASRATRADTGLDDSGGSSHRRGRCAGVAWLVTAQGGRRRWYRGWYPCRL